MTLQGGRPLTENELKIYNPERYYRIQMLKQQASQGFGGGGSSIGLGGSVGGGGTINVPGVEVTGPMAAGSDTGDKIYDAAARRLKEKYDESVRGTVNNLSARGMSANPKMSSIASEDIGKVNSAQANALSDLAGNIAASEAGIQGQNISNLVNLQSLGLKERQQALNEQDARNQLLYRLMGM